MNGIIPGLSVQQEEISMNDTIFSLFNGNKWKLLEQRVICSQEELLNLDFITNLKLGPVLMGFVNAFNKCGLSFKWLGSVVRESGPRYGFEWKAYETHRIFLI